MQGLKQEYFAGKLGVSQQYVSQLERSPTLSDSVLKKAAKIFNVPVETIVNFDEGAQFMRGLAKEGATRSMEEVMDYFKAELSKRDERVDLLEAEVREYRSSKLST